MVYYHQTNPTNYRTRSQHANNYTTDECNQVNQKLDLTPVFLLDGFIDLLSVTCLAIAMEVVSKHKAGTAQAMIKTFLLKANYFIMHEAINKFSSAINCHLFQWYYEPLTLLLYFLNCDVRYEFRITTMFGSSLPPDVCMRAHVLFPLFVFVCV